MNEHEKTSIAGFDPSNPDLSSLLWLGDQLPGGFFLYREGGEQELLHVNQAVLRIFGCGSLEDFRALTGYTFRGMVHPEDYPRVQASIERQIADRSNDNLDYVEYRIRRRDGELRWVEDYGHYTQLPGYGPVYYVFLSDVTEKRRSQEERHHMELELLEEKRFNEIKNNFLFNISHDIRTPMNAIIGYSELARRHFRQPELLEEYLDKIALSSRQMLCIIDDMLEMNRLEGGRFVLKDEPVQLRGQLELLLESYRVEAEERHLCLREELALDESRVLADPSALRRMLSNLLGNAMKFTPRNGTVTLTARQSPEPQGERMGYTITVADTGIGISPAFLERMYNAFEREETSTQSGTFGTGLGLTIVKNLLDRMGGTISVQSEKGKGTTFTIALSLPLLPGEEASAPRETAQPRIDGPLRILVVEDVELNLLLAEALLEESGFEVECAVNGREAVDAVAEHPTGYFDLILMDIQMPVMDGYEATLAIRALGEKGALPIVALSANAREEDRRKSREFGMDEHVAKPFDIDELVQVIHEQITAKKR